MKNKMLKSIKATALMKIKRQFQPNIVDRIFTQHSTHPMTQQILQESLTQLHKQTLMFLDTLVLTHSEVGFAFLGNNSMYD